MHDEMQTHIYAGRRIGALSQSTERQLLEAQGRYWYRFINGALIYLAQVSRHGILYAVNLLARAILKPSKAQMGTAKHVLRCLVR